MTLLAVGTKLLILEAIDFILPDLPAGGSRVYFRNGRSTLVEPNPEELERLIEEKLRDR